MSDSNGNNEDSNITYKMILIGDSNVGKTCIFKKIIQGDFVEKSISTIGIDRRTLTFNIKVKEGEAEVDKAVEVQLWDTAGQERFRSITKGYFKSSQGLILLYDITKKESFDNIENWIESIKESLGENNDYLVFLLGNKLDLAQSAPESREVTLEEAKGKCDDQKIFWGGECSAKDFTEEQLREMFTTFTKEIYKKVGTKIMKGQVVDKSHPKKKSRC